jgi:hypothetical protein
VVESRAGNSLTESGLTSKERRKEEAGSPSIMLIRSIYSFVSESRTERNQHYVIMGRFPLGGK